MADVITRFKVDTSQYDPKIRGAKKSLDGFSKSFGGLNSAVGASMAKFASWTAAIAAAGQVASYMVRVNMEFEKSNANLAAVLGTSISNIRELTVDAKKLGASTQYTASQVTGLQTELAKLGFSQSEIKNATKDVLNLAAATGADLSGAAATAGAALRAFGLDATQMDRVASTLAVSTTKSALSFDKLAVALPIVAPVAKQFGFTIEDTVALLGKLSDAGFDASSAATATRNIFLNMADESGKLAKALGRPIKSIDDLAPALEELKRKGVNLADMLALTDKRSVAAFATFLDGAGSLRQLRDSITDCNDELQQMVDTQMNTAHGSFLQMQSAWDGLMLSFSNSNGIIKRCEDAITNLLTAWTKWRNRSTGGDEGIESYTYGVNKEKAEAALQRARDRGMTDEQINASAKKQVESLTAYRDELYKYYTENIDHIKHYDGREEFWNKDMKELIYRSGYKRKAGEDANKMIQRILGTYNDRIAYQQYFADATATQDEYTDNDNTTHGFVLSEVTSSAKGKKGAAHDIGTTIHNRWKDNPFGPGTGEYDLLRAKRDMIEGSMAGPNLTKEEYAELAAELAKVNAEIDAFEGKTEEAFDPESLRGLQSALKDAQEALEGCVVGSEAWSEALLKVVEAQSKVDEAQKLINDATGKSADRADDTGVAWDSVLQSVSQVGSSLQQVDNKGANVAGIILQAIANVVSGFAQASAKQGADGNVWEWIAASVSGVATMIGTIASIKSATSGYAEGGIVLPNGSPYQGDNIVARLNAGEGILTQDGISNVSSLLGQNSISTMHLEKIITGEEMRLVIDNSNRRRGGTRGEFSRVR